MAVELTREQLEQLKEKTRSLSPEEREKLAQEYRRAAAPGVVFEYMHRGGWRPASQLAGDGITGGALDEVDPARIRAAAARKRAAKRRKKT
jgi:hypothetical protein